MYPPPQTGVEAQDKQSRILLLICHMYPPPQTGVEAQDNKSNQRAARRPGTQGQSPQRRGSFSLPFFFFDAAHSLSTIYACVFISLYEGQSPQRRGSFFLPFFF